MFNSRPFLKPVRPGIRKPELLLRKVLNWKKWTAGWEAHAQGQSKTVHFRQLLGAGWHEGSTP